ncbi:MAG: hypothetical protein C5B54_03820 [Acidobacteria bacterium]|nr:MAG: hypothetical protein C5B54_03820 [Acidobacteriota bacterium]
MSDSTSQQAIPSLESILCTEELQHRPWRSHDYARETRALTKLAHALAESPQTILQTLAETILDTTRADSAGLALLRKEDEGKTFYWPAVAGAWKMYIGRITPRDFSPSGDVLDRNIPLLFKHLQLRYTHFAAIKEAPAEALFVPFFINGKAVGTVWAVIHNEERKFDAEDERLLVSLGRVASLAYQTLMSIQELKFQMAERERADTELQKLNNELEVRVQIRTKELEESNREIKKLRDHLHKENIALREELDKSSIFEEIVGNSSGLKEVLSRVTQVAPTDSTVLITGETGTGKELIARAIHKRSKRSGNEFLAVNCSAIPSSLIASELFGHEKGAFTGAVQRKLGRFELADGGTIFLDEISELPIETQVALLRFLQEREFERVGGQEPIKVDVRVVAATNCDLEKLIAVGTFRSDLFYRLNVFPIKIPPLRERQEDIPMLAEYFIARHARNLGKRFRRLDKKTLNAIRSYRWPGNVRELQNVIERSAIVCNTENFLLDERWVGQQSALLPPGSDVFTKELVGFERRMIETALEQTKGRVSGPKGAALKLGIPASTLDSKIRSLGINKHRFK